MPIAPTTELDIQETIDALDPDLVADPAEFSGPDYAECLYCYLVRMTAQYDCDMTLRFTERWVERQARSHGWVLPWVKDNGGYCDCEVIANALGYVPRTDRHRDLRCEYSY